MWRRPVTFGGGMTITNFGAPGAPDGWKRPSFSQREYQRSSKAAGSKVLSRPRAGVAAESIMADMKKGLFGALSYQKAGTADASLLPRGRALAALGPGI